MAYKGAKIDAKTPPRLFLIAPSFTDNVKRIAKYVNADLKLLEYHAIENEEGERGLICTELDFGQPPQPSIMTIEEKLKYCTDDKVRELFKAVLDELKTQGIEVKPIGGLDITFWYKGKRFMVMTPRRKAFAANVLSSGGTWIGTQNIAARKDWDKVYTSQVKPYLTYLDAANNE